MQTVTYKFSLSEAGQRAAILAGLPAETDQMLSIPVSAEALAVATIAADGSATVSALDMRAYPHQQYDTVPTAEQVVAEIAAYHAAREARRSANFGKYDFAVLDPVVMGGLLRRLVDGQYPEYALPGSCVADKRAWIAEHAEEHAALLPAVREILAAERAAEVEKRRLVEEANAEADVRRAADKRARTESMRAWAAEHGSDRLQQMMAMQVGDWLVVAEDEFFAANTPAEYSREQYDRSDSCDDRRRPTEAELIEYAAMLATVASSGGVLANPGLRYHTIVAREDEDGERCEAEHYTAVDVEITAPTGRTVTVAKIIE